MSETLRRETELRARMKDAGIDVLFATPSANLQYLTGLTLHVSERLAALILPRDGDPAVVCPAFEESNVRRSSKVPTVLTWTETEDPFALAASRFSGSGVIGFEPQTPYDFAERLLDRLPGWKARSAGAVLAPLRMKKTAEELDRIRAGVKLTLERYERTFASLRPGQTEKEVSERFGGVNVVQFGPNAAVPHGGPSSRALQKNECVLIDAWDNPEGYFSDLTRSTWYGGPPPAKYVEVWNVVREAQAAAAAAARPGLTCEALDQVARDVITKAGYGEYFTHRLGHGLGIDVHEPPYLVGGSTIPLEPEMTFTIEPGIYVPGELGVRIEDDYVVTATGAEPLSPMVKGLEVIG